MAANAPIGFWKTFGAHTLGTTLGGVVAVPSGMGIYELTKSQLMKRKLAAPPGYMTDEFQKRITKSVSTGLKDHQIRNLKIIATLYAVPVALSLVYKVVKKSMDAGRNKLASGVQQVGEKAANNIKAATHESASVITPEQK
jgi:hypothetical protein